MNKNLQKIINLDLLTIINSVSPSIEDIKKEIIELRSKNSDLNNKKLSEKFASKVIKNYTSFGVASALPSAIPGIGTIGQITIEGTTVITDLTLMLRQMAKICYGIGIINGKDMQEGFNQDVIVILGMWSGVIISTKIAVEKIGVKVAIVQFNKNISGKVLQKINQKVGTTILTKWGGKRGGIALGRLVPFGVGAVVGGGFNYFTMNGFTKVALKHYEANEETQYVIIE